MPHAFGELAGEHPVRMPDRAATVAEVVTAVTGDPGAAEARFTLRRVPKDTGRTTRQGRRGR